MPRKAIGDYTFAQFYPLYLAKVERKGRDRQELDAVLQWLTSYDDAGLAAQASGPNTLAAFFDQAPQLHENAGKITGVICGVRMEDIDDPLVQKIRWMDKLVDELARGKAVEKILR